MYIGKKWRQCLSRWMQARYVTAGVNQRCRAIWGTASQPTNWPERKAGGSKMIDADLHKGFRGFSIPTKHIKSHHVSRETLTYFPVFANFFLIIKGVICEC